MILILTRQNHVRHKGRYFLAPFVLFLGVAASLRSFAAKPSMALNAVSAQGRTALYDSVGEGLKHPQYGRWSKKALVIMSDGRDNASHLSFSHVLGQARQSRALIYAIVLSSPVNGDENPGLLWRLCKDTGGRAYSPAEDSVVSVSKNIARDLREQYTLGYATQNVERPDAFRKIEVKVMASGHGKVRVRTRQGYFLAVSSQLPTQPGSGAG